MVSFNFSPIFFAFRRMERRMTLRQGGNAMMMVQRYECENVDNEHNLSLLLCIASNNNKIVMEMYIIIDFAKVTMPLPLSNALRFWSVNFIMTFIMRFECGYSVAIRNCACDAYWDHAIWHRRGSSWLTEIAESRKKWHIINFVLISNFAYLISSNEIQIGNHMASARAWPYARSTILFRYSLESGKTKDLDVGKLWLDDGSCVR